MSLSAIRTCVSVAAAVCALAPATRVVGLEAQGGQQKSALVTVVADRGSPMRDLTAKDFTVYDDNTKREVTAADLASEPLSIVMLVDTTQPPMSVPLPTQDLRASLATFVKIIRAGNADAQFALGEFAGAAVTTVDFTAKGPDVDAAIARLYPAQHSGAVLLEALADAGKKVAERPAPRRAIVSIDFNSPELSAESAMKAAAESIHKAGATLWAASVRGTATTSPTRENVLTEVTKANGGMRFSSIEPSGLEGMLKTIANSLSSQYIVTFSRPGGSPKATRFETASGAKVLLAPFMR